jgi:hypothetical protein
MADQSSPARTCLYCDRAISDSPGARHPTPEDYLSAMDALASIRAEVDDRAALEFRKRLRSRLRGIRVLNDFGAGTKAGWNEAIDYVREILRSTPLPTEWVGARARSVSAPEGCRG